MSHDEAVSRLDDNERALIKARARYDAFRRAAWGLAALALVTTLALIVALLVSVQNTQDALESCTVPGRPCYQESQRRSATLVGEIVKAQQDAVLNGSKPARENLELTKSNAQNLAIALAILEAQYPDAAAAARQKIEKGK